MEIFHPSNILNTKFLGNKEFQLKGSPVRTIFKEAELMHRELSDAILAIRSGQIVGFAGFATSGYYLLEADPKLIELKKLIVTGGFHRQAIGSTLLEYSREFAKSRGKKIILQAFSPGGLMDEETRREKYPLTTAQLKNFYLKNGFRELTPEEIERLTLADEDRYLSRQLWRYGLNPINLSITVGMRSTISREDVDKLSNIPYTEKLRILKDYLDSRYGSSLAIFTNRALQRKNIGEHLIQI